jgi:hypothetical protein
MKVELHGLWRSLHDGEYLYLVLESMLPFGLAAGALMLGLGLLLSEARVKLAGLITALFSCMSVWPATDMRGAAMPRILAMTEEVAFHKLMSDQAVLRASWNGFYYFVALVLTVALALSLAKKGRWIHFLSLALCIMASIHALWLHKKECEVFHRNIVKNHAASS